MLLEYDKRFSGFGEDFIFYDYKNPLGIPRGLASGFDVVFADPPFLSDECLTKTAVTVKFMAKDKIILCTGTYYIYTIKLSGGFGVEDQLIKIFPHIENENSRFWGQTFEIPLLTFKWKVICQ